MREMAERRQQLENEGEETKSALQKNQTEDKDVSDDDLENEKWHDPTYYVSCLPPVLEEGDLDVGGKG